MTNLQTFQEELNRAMARHETDVRFARGTEEEKAAAIADAWAVLDERVADIRARYQEYRENELATWKETSVLNTAEIKPWYFNTNKRIAAEYLSDLLMAADTAEQNAILGKLANDLTYFADGQKAIFHHYIPQLHELLFDKTASKPALRAVYDEAKNFVNPYKVKLVEAEALPTVLGEDYDAKKAEYEASLEQPEETPAE